MASAYSTPKQFDNYVQPVNLDLVNFVLQSKEQKFNYNIAKVEQTLSEFGNLGLVRDKDKEYLVDKINSITSQMGDLQNMDWSDSNVERQITSGIKGAIDGKVKNDIQMSRKYTSYMENVQKLKEENDGRYHDINYAMGLKNAGVDKWLAGDTESFGDLQYKEYEDVRGQQNEFIQEYIKTHGDEQVVEINDEVKGIKQQITYKGLDRDQVAAIWEANMTPSQRQQLQLEADYYYGETPPEDQKRIIKGYKVGLKHELDRGKKSLQKKKGELTKKSPGVEKDQLKLEIEQIEANINSLETGIKEADFKTAYSDGYQKGVKQDIINANSFKRITDIKRDKTLLDGLKTHADMAAKEAEARQEASGDDLTVDSAANFDSEKSNLGIYTEQVTKQSEESIDGLLETIGASTENMSDQEFLDTFGISVEDFNNKSKDDNIDYFSDLFQDIDEEGIELNGEGNYSPEVINAYQKYKSASNSLNAVNNNIKKVSNTVSKKTFEGMVGGVKGGDLSIDNFKNPVIRKIIKDSADEDLTYESLSEDEVKAFRAALIDETIREGYADKELEPFLLENRKRLINEIDDENLKKSFTSEEVLEGGFLGNLLEGTKEAAIAIASSMGGLRLPSASSPARTYKAMQHRDEMHRNWSVFDVLTTDEDLNSLNNRWTGEEDFIVDGEPKEASQVIRNQYRGALEKARTEAGEQVVKMPNTYVISLNPEIKADKREAKTAQQYISANNPGVGTDEFGNNAVLVHYNQSDNTVILSSPLKGASQSRFDKNEPLESQPIPLSKLSNMPRISNRIQTDETPWQFNSKNPSAAPLKFKSKGYPKSSDRTRAINKIGKILPKRDQVALNQAPTSIGYTHKEVNRKLSRNRREEDEVELSFAQEFPATLQSLSTGEGTFEINYESIPDQGYFSRVDYVIGDEIIPITPPEYVGQSLNYQEAYVSSFQSQREAVDYINDGYANNNPQVLNTLTEIESLYGTE